MGRPNQRFVVFRFVELQPRSKTFYGFKENEAKGEAMMAKHAEGIVHLFDSILQMLGKSEKKGTEHSCVLLGDILQNVHVYLPTYTILVVSCEQARILNLLKKSLVK